MEKRKQRAVYFDDDEWDKVKNFTKLIGEPNGAGTVVRKTMMIVASEPKLKCLFYPGNLFDEHRDELVLSDPLKDKLNEAINDHSRKQQHQLHKLNSDLFQQICSIIEEETVKNE